MTDREKVNHYADKKIETFDYMLDTYGPRDTLVFCVLNIQKYVSRAFRKGQLRSDLVKIRNYANLAIEALDLAEAEKAGVVDATHGSELAPASGFGFSRAAGVPAHAVRPDPDV